ncbi:uncharacterized protein [Chiloscyllium punctatum]|uniref:uncharacterized protein n=1 Tax=Chiloscyllium punctatum TaxID=137246 RepID=UPI003B63FCF0
MARTPTPSVWGLETQTESVRPQRRLCQAGQGAPAPQNPAGPEAAMTTVTRRAPCRPLTLLPPSGAAHRAHPMILRTGVWRTGGPRPGRSATRPVQFPSNTLLPSCQDYRDRNNMVKRLTPDFSEREGFFDLVWEVQSRRLNDQRCSFRRSRDRRPYRSLPSSPLDRENPFFASMSSLQTEEFFDLIACSQSRRLNDQRADFEESPTVALCAPFPTGPVEYLAPLGSMASQTQSAVSPPAAPAEGEETPAEGRERPTEAEEQPAEHEQNPVGRERLPTEGGQAPAERQEIPAEGEVDPGELQEIPAEGEEAPVYKAMYQVQMSTGTKGPDDELYNIILSHQSASARIEDQRCDPSGLQLPGSL